MKKPLKIGLIVTVVVALLGAGIYAFTQEAAAPEEPATTSSASTKEQAVSETQPNPEGADAATAGRYTGYSEAAVSDANYDTTIVFFYAPWCPECRAFKTAINDGPLPDGVQILEADFDSSTDLKKQYGVTLQSTFVRVNTSGDLQKKWSGYGQDKSLSNVLENLN